jgi:hypothetical protein
VLCTWNLFKELILSVLATHTVIECVRWWIYSLPWYGNHFTMSAYSNTSNCPLKCIQFFTCQVYLNKAEKQRNESDLISCLSLPLGNSKSLPVAYLVVFFNFTLQAPNVFSFSLYKFHCTPGRFTFVIFIVITT